MRVEELHVETAVGIDIGIGHGERGYGAFRQTCRKRQRRVEIVAGSGEIYQSSAFGLLSEIGDQLPLLGEIIALGGSGDGRAGDIRQCPIHRLRERERSNAMAKPDKGDQHDTGGRHATGHGSLDGVKPGDKRQTVGDDDEHADDIPMLRAEILNLPEQQSPDGSANQHGALQRRQLKQMRFMVPESYECSDSQPRNSDCQP